MTASPAVDPAMNLPTLTTQLQSQGITKAAVIDDAYDTPTMASFLAGEPAAFWGAIERREELMKELAGLGGAEVTSADDFTDDLLTKLWERRNDGSDLSAEAREHLFKSALEKLKDVERLEANLNEFGLTVERVGSAAGLPSQDTKLVFLDYYLGTKNDVVAVGVSTNKAQELYKQSKEDAGKPFIVLMSSSPDADAAQENFRKASGLLAGLFGFLAKADLHETEKLRIKLTTWALGLPARHQIQRFVEAFEHSLTAARDEFISRLRGLALEDYVNMQWLSLQADGHPLGDYMLWLYKGLLVHLVHDNDQVLARQNELNALSFDNFLPAQGRATLNLADLYTYAITDPGVKDVSAHPRATKESKEPYLHHGDLFVKAKSKEVLLIINAACDLAYSPGTNRKFPRDHTVIFARGVLQQLVDTPSPGGVSTEPFARDGRVVRIAWDPKRVLAQDYQHVWEWLNKEGYSRVTRLNVAHSIEIQQAFASNLTRVGMPVKPPGWLADVELFCDGGELSSQKIGDSIQDGAFIVRRNVDGKEQVQFALTVECIMYIVGRLDHAVSEYEKQKTELQKSSKEEGAAASGSTEVGRAKIIREGKLKGLEGKLHKLALLRSQGQAWLPMLQSLQQLPIHEGHIEIDKKLVWVWRDGEFSGKFPNGPPLAINIRIGSADDEATLQKGSASTQRAVGTVVIPSEVNLSDKSKAVADQTDLLPKSKEASS